MSDSVEENMMQPFPNGTSFCDWQSTNCDSCKKFNHDDPYSSCKIDLAIGLAYFGDGKINKEIAELAGWSGSGYLPHTCADKAPI
jgi:hypothetical protein